MIVIQKLSLLIKDNKMNPIFAAIIFFATMAKAEPIVVKLATDGETLEK
jgi:hypothetical protein